MQIQLTIGETVLSATLLDNAASRDFAALLPLTLSLRDFAAAEKISDLPSRLSTADCPAGATPDIGGIAYYRPWGNLAIFYRGSGYAAGLVTLGRLDSGIEQLAAQRGEFTVTFELAQ
jgi:hypothetical protein